MLPLDHTVVGIYDPLNLQLNSQSRRKFKLVPLGGPSPCQDLESSEVERGPTYFLQSSFERSFSRAIMLCRLQWPVKAVITADGHEAAIFPESVYTQSTA